MRGSACFAIALGGQGGCRTHGAHDQHALCPKLDTNPTGKQGFAPRSFRNALLIKLHALNAFAGFRGDHL